METTENKGVKARIVSAAWQLFHDKGYDLSTIILIQRMSCSARCPRFWMITTKNCM